MTYPRPDALASTEWLARHLRAPDIRVVDASYFLPWETGDARADYRSRHLPGAVFFDIDEIADTDSDLPHMLPSPEKFSSRVRKLGLGDGVRIVIYDSHGIRTSARVWWTFRAFGHKDVAVLDGGLPKWLAEGRPTEDLPPMPRERHFTSRLNHLIVRDRRQIQANIASEREQVLDARSRDRFSGDVGEPWEGRRGGHIPGSRCLPHAEILTPNQTVIEADALKAKFTGAGIDLDKPVVTSCGSGVTASVLALGLHLLGKDDVAVYDGSWAEWGLSGPTPVETGSGG